MSKDTFWDEFPNLNRFRKNSVTLSPVPAQGLAGTFALVAVSTGPVATGPVSSIMKWAYDLVTDSAGEFEITKFPDIGIEVAEDLDFQIREVAPDVFLVSPPSDGFHAVSRTGGAKEAAAGFVVSLKEGDWVALVNKDDEGIALQLEGRRLIVIELLNPSKLAEAPKFDAPFLEWSEEFVDSDEWLIEAMDTRVLSGSSWQYLVAIGMLGRFKELSKDAVAQAIASMSYEAAEKAWFSSLSAGEQGWAKRQVELEAIDLLNDIAEFVSPSPAEWLSVARRRDDLESVMFLASDKWAGLIPILAEVDALATELAVDPLPEDEQLLRARGVFLDAWWTQMVDGGDE